jgi:AcrR family transcriptional regulator
MQLSTENENNRRRRLDRGQWIDAAIAVLAAQGAGALTVENVARHLGVSKGSFYHHFEDRQDLVGSVLANWAKEHTTEHLMGRFDHLTDPGKWLDAIVNIGPSDAEANQAVRQWGLADSGVAAAVARVDAEIVEVIAGRLRACGVGPEDALLRAFWLLAIFTGTSSLDCDTVAAGAGDDRRSRLVALMSTPSNR